MDLIEQISIKQKIGVLVDKWKDKKPKLYSAEYWRYRADQLYYLALKKKLETTKNV